MYGRNWNLNYDAEAKKFMGRRPWVHCRSDNDGIEKVYPGVAQNDESAEYFDKWTMWLQSETCRRKAQLDPARSSECFI